MAEIIRMPKMSDTMEEGVIASWIKKEGDEVSSGDILAEVETDKATMELESYQDGVLLHIGVKEQDAVPVDGVIAIIGEKGEDITDLLKEIEAEGNQASEDDDPSKESSSEEESTSFDTSNINATVITMPKMSDTMEEGVIASWLKSEGDEISSGDILAEVETDKATMELEAYEDGILLHIAIEAGGAVPVDGPIAIVGEKGADWKALLNAHNSGSKQEEQSAPKKTEDQQKEEPKQVTQSDNSTSLTENTSNGRIKASPLAKKLAEEKGINIEDVNGSGDGGRIIKRDIEDYTPKAKPKEAPASKTAAEQAPSFSIPSVIGEVKSEDVPLSQMRKAIAKRLADSKFSAPHFYVTMEINMDKAIEARKSMNEISPVKISYNDMVVKASASALRQNPDLNVSWLGDKIKKHHHINIGIAVAIPDGLIVPVVKFTDNKSLSHISAEIKELGQKAKNKTLKPEEFSGNTFTISNLGMFGVEEFTAIINPPDACILAVGGIKETVVVKNGEMKVGNVMKVTLSSDHRAVDGAKAAAFLKTLKDLLEDPVRILI